MAESTEQICQEKALEKKSDGGDIRESEFLTESSVGDSINSSNISSCSSSSSSSSSDMIEDATSPTSSSSHAYGPLYELSELMAQLPIKRGLSKYYEGKAQTFGSLASVESLEDLAKKGRSWRRGKMVKSASSKSYGGGGLDINGILRRPKAAISKSKNKMSSSTSRVSISLASSSSSSSLGKRRSPATTLSMSSCSPSIPLHKNL